MTSPRDIDARMYDAIEYALWQDLANALNRLSEYGLDVVAGFCEGLGVKPTNVVDAGDVIHGGAVREDGEGYMLRYQPTFTPDPDDPTRNLPFGWQVKARESEQREAPHPAPCRYPASPACTCPS